MTNTDPKGCVRAVEEYRVTPFGLYMARPTPGRAQFHYLESWLLPALRLRVSDFWFSPGHELDQDLYLDVASVEETAGIWRTEDHYLDLVLRTGREVELLDVDELLSATLARLLDTVAARRALQTAYRAVDGLARHGYDLRRWLSTMDIALTWRRR
ncbi:MAG: DUF402 domain-containing protein [Jatrophihabitantaceae bacterium]